MVGRLSNGGSSEDPRRHNEDAETLVGSGWRESGSKLPAARSASGPYLARLESGSQYRQRVGPEPKYTASSVSAKPQAMWVGAAAV